MLRGVLAVCLFATTANAATFVVNSLGDAGDQTLDGICLTAGGECTLRAAIEEANATAAADTIEFQIVTAGVMVIAPAIMLPPITNPVHIDGRTQPGYAGTPLVVLEGASITAGSRIGLTAAAGLQVSGLTVRGFDWGIELGAACTLRASHLDNNTVGVSVSGSQTLVGGVGADRNVFTRNSQAGVYVGNAIDIAVIGNYFGTTDGATVQSNGIGVRFVSGAGDVAGNLMAGNGIGVSIESPAQARVHDNLIGTNPAGTDALGPRSGRGVMLRGAQDSVVEHNTIANCMWGIDIWGAFRNTVRGNYIGTTSAGTGTIGNDIGIYLHNDATMNTIGGPVLADRNVVVGSATGIQVEFSPSNSFVGNLIGRDVANVPQPNTRGISIVESAATITGNVIANNTTFGLSFGRFEVRVSNNSIFSNGALGIELGDPGPTLPNAGDGIQDIPLLAAASTDGTSTFVRGTVTGAASSTIDLEVFASSACDPSGYGEGETRIGTLSVQTNSSGDGSFLIPASAVAAGTSITATAFGTSTSEFSACVATVACPTIVVAPATPPNPQLGVAYTQSLTASGGAGNYTFSVTGTLPPGLSVAADGTLTGTPTTAGTFTFTVSATDLNGCHGQRTYSLSVCAPITLAPTTIADGTTQSSYNVTISASGGTPAYSYAVSSGAAPTGLTLSTAGVLSGTPTAGGDFTFAVTATDANACNGTQTYVVHIDSCGGTLQPATLPMAVTGNAYDVALSVDAGVAPFSFAVTAGTLPAGIALAGNHLTGTPTGSGDATFTITATDALGCTTSRAYTLMTTCAAIAIGPSTLDAGMEGAPYTAMLTATGGAAPYTFTSTTLPPGLALSSSGTLSGEPDQAGDYTFTVTATDTNGCVGMIDYAITIDQDQGDNGCGCATNDKSGGPTLLLCLLAWSASRRSRRCRSARS